MLAARPYQLEAIESVHTGWTDPDVRHQLLSMATGCGKTVVFSLLAKDEVQRGGRVLILAHTDELIEQALDKFTQSTGMRAGKEKAQSRASRLDKVVVGSVQTIQGESRLASWPKNQFGLVVVDEAHRSTSVGYQKILNYFAEGGAKVVGVTATTDRGDKRSLGEFYQRIAFDYGLKKAVLDGWLVRPLVKTMPIEIDLTGVGTKQTPDGSDVDRQGVSARLVPLMDAIAGAIRAEIGLEKVLIFLPSVETAQMMSDALVRAGVSSLWVCGDRKLCPDRTERVARHKAGEVQALCNMAVLTEGYDDDSIRNIVCLRATKIRSLYAQIIGRGTRPIAGIVPALNAAADSKARLEIIRRSSKPHVRILDFLWLYEKHDLCTPASLVTDDIRLQELMAGKEGDLLEAEMQAERDLLAKLEQEVRKNARKRSTTVDPLALATELGDVELATYEPLTSRECSAPTERQKEILAQNGIKIEAVASFGHASLLIERILARHAKGLSTVRQINFFKKLKIDASNWRAEYAAGRQREQIAKWQARRAEQKALAEEHDGELAEVARQLNLDVDSTLSTNRHRLSLLAAEPLPDPEAPMEDFSELFR